MDNSANGSGELIDGGERSRCVNHGTACCGATKAVRRWTVIAKYQLKNSYLRPYTVYSIHS